MRITEIKSYYVADPIEKPIVCKFLNRYGSWDCMQLTKNKTQSVKTDPEWYYTTQAQRVMGVSSTHTISYFTPWMDGTSYEWMNDLALSPEVYIDGKYVKIMAMEHEYDSTQYIYQFEIKVSPQFEQNHIRN